MMYVMSFCSAHISLRLLAASTGSIETSIGDLDASTAGLSPFMGRIFPEHAFDGPVCQGESRICLHLKHSNLNGPSRM